MARRKRLVAAREAVGHTQESLARVLGVETSTVARWENGAMPRAVNRVSLAQVLGVETGELAIILSDNETPKESEEDLDPDALEALKHALEAPSGMNFSATSGLGDILASQRRLDDVLPAQALIPGIKAQWEILNKIGREVRGSSAVRYHSVAAEWIQFLGWLYAEARQDSKAVGALESALSYADEIESGELAAQAANFRGYLARQQGNPRGIIRWFLTAYHTPGANPLQRVGDAVQAAHGYGLIGNRKDGLILLREAERITDGAGDVEPPGTAYWLTPTFSRINIGLALLGLGEPRDAADQLEAGLTGLPPDQQRAEWADEYWEALELARAKR